MHQNHLKSIYHANVNINLMVESVIQIKSGIMINVGAHVKTNICEKDYTWNPATFSCKNGKYLASIIDSSVITCDEIIDAVETKTVTTNFNEKNIICETKSFYILLVFLWHYS